MIIIGLTGSIGMGKSFVSQCVKGNMIGVFDADEEIHKLMQDGGEAIEKVGQVFPESVDENGEINRAILGDIVFKNTKKLQQLEAILHPILRRKGEEFIAQEQKAGSQMIVQDIPLLYETGADKECHVVIVVSAPPNIQQQRVMQRKNMTDAKYQAILKLQLLQKEKQDRADFVIHTDCKQDEVKQQVNDIIKKIKKDYINGKS